MGKIKKNQGNMWKYSVLDKWLQQLLIQIQIPIAPHQQKMSSKRSGKICYKRDLRSRPMRFLDSCRMILLLTNYHHLQIMNPRRILAQTQRPSHLSIGFLITPIFLHRTLESIASTPTLRRCIFTGIRLAECSIDLTRTTYTTAILSIVNYPDRPW